MYAYTDTYSVSVYASIYLSTHMHLSTYTHVYPCMMWTCVKREELLSRHVWTSHTYMPTTARHSYMSTAGRHSYLAVAHVYRSMLVSEVCHKISNDQDIK